MHICVFTNKHDLLQLMFLWWFLTR